eukprot:TRINITY_DN431472_c4_g1_i1.p1 TRINITY_DN431472_c4_g1~~TRINITY_DN431472_c4_g1_i1.p1  ORF type:complete len:335 (+),score=84.05 TRINITY_DN431472_c4_g1_i1:99-1103(+)
MQSLRSIKANSKGRLELLSWLNEFLQSDVSKVEQLCNGVAFAQIIGALYPNKVPLHKLTLSARYETDCIANLRILERSIKGLSLGKEIDIHRMAKGNFQENMECLQWCYALYEKKGSPQNYNGYQARENAFRKAKKGFRDLPVPIRKQKNDVNPNLMPTHTFFENGGSPPKPPTGSPVRPNTTPAQSSSPITAREYDPSQSLRRLNAERLVKEFASSNAVTPRRGAKKPISFFGHNNNSIDNIRRRAYSPDTEGSLELIKDTLPLLRENINKRLVEDRSFHVHLEQLHDRRDFLKDRLRQIEMMCERFDTCHAIEDVLDVLVESNPEFDRISQE